MAAGTDPKLISAPPRVHELIMRVSLFRFIAATLATALITLSGCGPRSDRLEISGQVTFNNAPLDSGSIRFTTLQGEKIFASGAMITNGGYHIPQEKGLPPGTYRVEINAPDVSAPLVTYPSAPGEPAAPPTAPERIPPEYNTNSKHSIEVTADGENHFVFDISSKGVK
jgi:hypothetical protein